MPIRVDVSEGKVLLSDVSVLHETENTVSLLVNCRTKYPEVGAVSTNYVSLKPSEHALHVGPGDRYTEIYIHDLIKDDEHWVLLTDTGRYEVYITLVRTDNCAPKVLWSNS